MGMQTLRPILLGLAVATAGLHASLEAQVIQGELFYSRSRRGRDPFRVKRIRFRYDGKTLAYGASIGVAQNIAVDGIVFSPRKTLLLAGQRSGRICEVDPAKASGGNVIGCSPRAPGNLDHLTMDPSQKAVWSSAFTATTLVEIPIQPKLGKPIVHRLTGGTVTQIMFAKGITFYTSSRGSGRGGTLGLLDMKTWRLTPKITNLTGIHGIAYDRYTDTLLTFGNKFITQIEASRTPKVLARLDVTKLPNAPTLHGNIDQGSVDGNGLVFAPTNGGNGPSHIIFLDIRKSRRVDRPDFSAFKSVEYYLDDIVPLSGAGCGATATWNTFGKGWKGTRGVPTVSLSAAPRIGTQFFIRSSNSLGRPTHGCLLLGLGSRPTVTPLGGTLFVDLRQPYFFAGVTIPAAGARFPMLIPKQSAVCGLQLYGQVVEVDPAASQGVSFTAGLRLRLGL